MHEAIGNGLIDLHSPEAFQRQVGGLDPKLYGPDVFTRLGRATHSVGSRLHIASFYSSNICIKVIAFFGANPPMSLLKNT